MRTIRLLATFSLVTIGSVVASSDRPTSTRSPLDRRPACCFTKQGCDERADCTEPLKEDGPMNYSLRTARHFFNQKDFQRAEAAYETYLAQSTDALERCEAQYERGRTLASLQFWNKAIEQWTQVAASTSCIKGPQALLAAGSVHGALGKWDDAIQDYQQLMTRFPSSPEKQEGQYQLIQSHFYKGDVKGASALFQEYKASYPTDKRNGSVSKMLAVSGRD